MDHKNNVSQTAMLIASLRALACYEEDPQIHGNDYLAELFIPVDKRSSLKATEYRPLIKKAIPEGLYEYVIARTKYFDELILQFLQQQVPQIVLLGAGYDSRAYRYAHQITKSKIYEVDAAATQQLKRQLLNENAIVIHPNVLYVSADFEHDDWFQGLYEAGYQSSLQTLYIWEGVTFYLSAETVDFMLNIIRKNSSAGSILSFDYQHMDNKNTLIDTGLKDENIKFGLNSHECSNYLNGLGYSVIDQLDSNALSNRYLTMVSGYKYGEVKSIMNIITAQIN